MTCVVVRRRRMYIFILDTIYRILSSTYVCAALVCLHVKYRERFMNKTEQINEIPKRIFVFRKF